MAHGHAQPVAIAELLLQVEFKAARACSITTSGICQDQEFFGCGNFCRPSSSHQWARAVTANAGVSAAVPT